VDIDADIENDVFISSKFFNYLMINRKILCITGKNSPVTRFVEESNVEYVYITNHTCSNIFQSILNNSSACLNIDRKNIYKAKLDKGIEI
jgi:hypothetical protein